MRVAVVSDIHGNLTALEAVIRDLETVGADIVVNGGDLAGNGARSADVIDRVVALDWPGVVGNTDQVLWDPKPLEAMASASPERAALWKVVFDDVAFTRDAVGEERTNWLRAQPDRWIDHGVGVVHASPGDCWKSPTAKSTDDEFATAYGPLESPLVVFGHLHQPFVRRVAGITIANSGSVGLPYDGDPRASYLVIDCGQPAIRRVEYDVEAEVRELTARRYPQHEWIAAILREGRAVPPNS